ncbi:DUF7305 domain-containing protein [Carnobacterium sp.]|uniref:DUF7305 domain-containing protein n=1 Tax=Carnobacterium sp. TaxID=48221 RepID=UPI003C782B92
MGIKQLRKEEKGSGLVLTLMVLLVLSVLGIAIGTLTIGSYRLSDATRDDTSAYYVAEAGAVAAYDQIQREVLAAYNKNATESAFYNEVSTILTKKNGQSNVQFDQQLGNTPSATILTKKVDAQNYTIYSTGEIAGKERTVTKPLTVKWVEKNTGGGGLPAVPANAVLLTKGDIEISEGGKLTGDIHTNSVIDKSIEISGGPNLTETTFYFPSTTTAEKLIDKKNNANGFKKNIAREKDIDFGGYQGLLNRVKATKYNPNDFKVLPDKIIQKDNSSQHKVQDNGNLFINSWMIDTYKIEVQENIRFDEIEIGAGKTLSFNPMGGNYTILVNDLSIMSGNLDIVGEGTITLVVNDEIEFRQTSKINVPGPSKQLLFIYKGGSPDFEGITQMNSNIISLGEDEDVEISNTNINGVFLTDSDEVSYSGGTPGGPSNMMLIAPNAEVSLDGGYLINGSVIAKTFEIKGGASLSYKPIDTTGFPFGSSGTTTDPKPEDIINSGTIVED